jgi:hypothetical protein
METTLREVVINGPIEDARFIEPNVKDGVLTFNSLASRKTGDPESVKADAPKPTTGNNETVALETMPNSARVTEVNFPNFTACTIPELQQTVPELQGLKPAPDQQQLSALLDKVGAKTVEIARSTPNLISRETVTELRKPPAVMQYDYLILNRIQGKAVFLDEFRVDLKTGDKFQTDEDLKDASSARAAVERASRDLAASQFGRRPISQGFAASWVHFYPLNRRQAKFRYLGQQKMDGHRTLVLAFAQKPQSVTSPAIFVSKGKNVPMFLQGVAWVDASDFHIWRLRTDLLTPLPDVLLHRLTADIQFKPTRVEEIPSLISLSLFVILFGNVLQPSAQRKAPHLCGGWPFESSRSYFPVPCKVGICGLLLALSFTISCPALFPVVVGVKVTLMVHLFLASKVFAHVVADIAKSPVADTEMLDSVML